MMFSLIAWYTLILAFTKDRESAHFVPIRSGEYVSYFYVTAHHDEL